MAGNATKWKNMPLAIKCRMRIGQNQVWPKLCCQGRGVAITARMIGVHPKTIPWGRLAQGIATATRIEADSISECPFTLYQILSVTQSKQQSFPNTNLDRLQNTGGYHPLNYSSFHLVLFVFCTRKGHNFLVWCDTDKPQWFKGLQWNLQLNVDRLWKQSSAIIAREGLQW